MMVECHANRRISSIGSDVVADYVDLSIGTSQRAFIDKMIELFDNPTVIEAYRNGIVPAGGRGVDRWY